MSEQIPNEESDAQFEMRRRTPDLPSLFPTEELIIPESLRNMRKAVSAIHATPLREEHAQSLNGRRLFDACILIAQLDFRKRPAQDIDRVRTERISPIFETRITELARLANIPGKNYTRIYKELDQLFEMTLQWNIVGEDSTVQWEMKSHFLSSLGHGRGLKRGLVRFSIDPSILEIVLEPNNWATLSLQAMGGLKSAASYALYQNTWRYVNTNAKVTAPLPVETWIELLLGKSRYVTHTPETGKRAVNYGDFKRYVLMDAIKKVNDIPVLGYELALKEIRSGKRVSRLQFKFVPKKSLGLGLPLMWPQDLVKALEALGFSERDIEDMSQARSHEEVAESLLRLKAAQAKKHALGQSISSPKEYFKGILTNVAMGAGADLDEDQVEEQLRAQEAAQQAHEREQRLRMEYERHLAERFAFHLFERWQEDERERLLQAFEATPSGASARLLVAKKGWSRTNVGALAALRVWMAKERPEDLSRLLPEPQCQSLQAWMAWRLDSASGT